MRLPYEILFLTGAFDGGFRGSDGDWFISALLFCYFCFPSIDVLVSEMKVKTKWIFILCLYILAGGAPIVQYFNKWGLVYPSPFFRMLQFTIGVILASCCADYSKSDDVYVSVFFEFMATLSFLILIVGIFFLTNRFPYWDYMYLTYFTIPVFILMIYFLYQVKKAVLLPELLQRVVLYFSAISLPFYIAQKFCFLITANVIAAIVPDQSVIMHLNLIRLLGSSIIGISMGCLFEFVDRKIKKIIFKKMDGYKKDGKSNREIITDIK